MIDTRTPPQTGGELAAELGIKRRTLDKCCERALLKVLRDERMRKGRR